MYDVDDVARSVRRYAATTLGEPWVIRLARSELTADRPAALLDVGDLHVGRVRAAINQGNVEQRLPLTLTCWPEPAPERFAAHVARGLAQQLSDLIAIGLDLGMDEHGRPVAGPLRVPLYDYSVVPIGGANRAGPEHPHDRLWVESWSTRAIQDPQEPQRWSVVLELTVSWEAPGRVPPPAPVVASMPGRWEPPG